MLKNWDDTYAGLMNYITKHREIKIHNNGYKIPDTARTRFYQLFNEVRTSYVKEYFQGLVDEAKTLSLNYIEVENDLINSLASLDKVLITQPELSRYLHNPVNELARELHQLLFDLLRSQIDGCAFNKIASTKIHQSFSSLQEIGYQKWVLLCLANFLDIDKLLKALPLKFASSEETTKMKSAMPNMPIPTPRISRDIEFKHEYETTLVLADFIAHSAKIENYLSVRSEITEAFCTVVDTNLHRERLPIDSITKLRPELTIICIGDNPKELALVADVVKICRPDLLLITKGGKCWFDMSEIVLMNSYHYSLKPRLGTYIVSMVEVPEEALSKLDDDIHILSVGYDRSKLAPIVEALAA